ncbi:hypothetical protein Pint_03239 [Pistacia integerrima]|uniref:Uncharacterized protein n=1 Tax=Pistacia integerrima TaxID=434235 RepID=A0ACC0ZLC1_9ROSI|nr:hypothetical protein Pint_03239 [Pistacia integerrima]
MFPKLRTFFHPIDHIVPFVPIIVQSSKLYVDECFCENCSGCKVDKLKELKQGLSIQNIISLWFVTVCN